MKKTAFLMIGLILIVGVPLISQNKSKHTKSVRTTLVDLHRVDSSIIASGNLIHKDRVELRAEVIGKVVEIFVKEGDQVKAGQLLMRIDDEQYKARVNQQSAQVSRQKSELSSLFLDLEIATRQWQRQQKLFKQGLSTQSQHDEAHYRKASAELKLESGKSALAHSKALLEETQETLNKTRISAPIDGVLTSLDVAIGETVVSGTMNMIGSSIMTISNENSLVTEVYVDEADAAALVIGLPVEVFVIASPNTPLKGRVSFIANTAKRRPGRNNLSFAVEIALDDVSHSFLRPGMSCRAEIFTNKLDSVLALPLSAIMFSEAESKYYVFVNDNGTAKKVSVKVGTSDDQMQQMISGVTQGQQVLVGPAKILRRLSHGDSISLIESKKL
ncbi:efflux RND transporter periplasmic adaptor subunit [Pleionea sediminis]|uniref:efflux RND transporter periplasmic adaptor subunit n=1 Tax=Pleionea sediminis TaxID=2569479 RepID=UPI0013DE522E|nr:efflux RND transporter periplasmic adaptor subunit [Pleionea sediminis]